MNWIDAVAVLVAVPLYFGTAILSWLMEQHLKRHRKHTSGPVPGVLTLGLKVGFWLFDGRRTGWSWVGRHRPAPDR